MAEKITFPMLPASSWWALRKRFRDSLPKEVTTGYLATILGTTESSARKNVYIFLKSMGIIDEDGKPTDLANRWRFDETYAEVCEEIRNKIYPSELLEALPKPWENRQATDRWFAAKTGLGKGASQRMSNLYILLCEADPTKSEKAATPVTKEKKKVSVGERPNKVKPVVGEEAQERKHFEPQTSLITNVPSIHIDLQIHLSPEATAEQIDQIFASMAKHFKGISK